MRFPLFRPLFPLCVVCLVVASGCSGPDEEANSAPQFTGWSPEEALVTVPAAGTTFEVEYSDPDGEAELTVSWSLDGRVQGNGRALMLYPADLGDDGIGTLVVTVTDDADASDTVVWSLEAGT